VGWREVERGDVLSAAGAELEPTHHLDARISLVERAERPLERGTRVQVHHGTREGPGRAYPLEGEAVAPGASALVQLRLESPLVPAIGDRLIVRQIAPPDTLGGGVVLDPRPRRHGGGEPVLRRLAAFERGEAPPEEPRANRASDQPVSSPPPEPPPLDDATRRLAEILHADGERPRADAELAEAAGLDPSAAHTRLSDLVRAGAAVRVARNLHFAPDPLARLESSIVALCERDGEATIAGVRDELTTSRRYAQALLEHLDAEKVTRRQGDAHVLRRRR
jgi:selenocysteine-specific elongation factor